MSKDKFDIPLRSVLYREGPWWIAHCLELDLVAEGKTPQSALRDLMELASTHIDTALASGDLESIFRPAPAEVWRMFWMARERDVPRKPPKPVGRFEARELATV